MLGNGVVGILSESGNKWERRAPLTPSHCARLLPSGKDKTGVARIIVQPSTKRIHLDAMYEDVGCEISDDLSECGLIVGIKQPKLDMILHDRAYAFFSHTHKAQKENMPLLDKVLAQRVSLYDYELIVGDHGKRLLAFGKFAGRAGFIDFLGGLGKRYLSLGYSTPFLSLGEAYMYSSLAAATAAVISVGEEIATFGLPSGICPLVFIFTGSGNGNVSHGAQEIFKLLPHTFVDPSRLPELFAQGRDVIPPEKASKRVFQVYGCVVTCQDMVEHRDSSKTFDKTDYYAHPEHYKPIFHEKIAPYASVIVNCMYWEKRFPRLLSTQQLQDLTRRGCPLIGIADITCDIEGSLEFINQTTSIDSPFVRYDPLNDSYHHGMEGDGVIFSSIDILPTQFAKEASQHFGDILSQFIGSLASTTDITKLPSHLRNACIAHGGALAPLFEYIPRMRKSDSEDIAESHTNLKSSKYKFSILVSLSGHLFDQFLINEALDIIEAAGGSFHLVKCQVGQSATAMSYSDLEVGANDRAVLNQIIDSLTSLANPDESNGTLNKEGNRISLKVGKVHQNDMNKGNDTKRKAAVLIIGAGRVCRPAVELLTSNENTSSREWYKACLNTDFEGQNVVEVVVASLYLKDAEEIIDGIPNASAVQLDVKDDESLCKYISQVEVVVSLLPPSCHIIIANACIKLKKHLVTASYVDDSMSSLHEEAKAADITILGEMGLDPGIAVETSRQKLQAYRGNQVPIPVLEEFIPLKTSTSETPEKTSNISDKANWMTTAQLWSQESNETKPQTTLTSPILTDIGFNVSSKLILDTKQRNGGAFLPFSKERNLCPSPTLALAACTDEHLELDHKRFSETENGFSCPKRESSGKKMVVIEQGKGAGNSSSSDGQATNTATIASASTNTSTSQTHRKARRCWSPDLHRRFVNALHMLGGSQVATPKQIRELMKVDGLTNDEVKSHLQKYRLHTRRPSPSPHAAGAPAPHLVVLGSIWVPPEYATAAAAAHSGGAALYGAHPASHAPPPHFCATPPASQDFYTAAAAPPPSLHHHTLHHQLQLFRPTSQVHSSPESDFRGSRDRSESIEDGKSESSSWKGESGENDGGERKGRAGLREEGEESHGSKF